VKVIAGLGNPGSAYAGTPHNVGFDVTELLAQRLGATWKESPRWKARVARATVAGEPLLLVQPLTFMNLSGTSVVQTLRYYGGGPQDLAVVLDDADLPLGRLRLRPEGGSGGHRGLASVIEQLGTGTFGRIRLGVGRGGRGDLVGFVLDKFPAEARDTVRAMVEAAADAASCWTECGMNEAMNRFNAWTAPVPRDGTESEKAT